MTTQLVRPRVARSLRFRATSGHVVRALPAVGATVIGIGERPEEWLDHERRGHLQHYHQIGSVTDVGALQGVVEWTQGKVWVDRLEATVEGHHPADRAGPRGQHHHRHLGPYRVAVPGQAVDEGSPARRRCPDGSLHADPAYAAERRLREQLAEQQTLYGLRLGFALEVVRAVERRTELAGVCRPAIDDAIRATQQLDEWHVPTVGRLRETFDAEIDLGQRPEVLRHRGEVAEQMTDIAGVVITGGHVGHCCRCCTCSTSHRCSGHR